jgi:hypothetical protein
MCFLRVLHCYTEQSISFHVVIVRFLLLPITFFKKMRVYTSRLIFGRNTLFYRILFVTACKCMNYDDIVKAYILIVCHLFMIHDSMSYV